MFQRRLCLWLILVWIAVSLVTPKEYLCLWEILNSANSEYLTSMGTVDCIKNTEQKDLARIYQFWTNTCPAILH